jgi:transcription antitermination factor NusB
MNTTFRSLINIAPTLHPKSDTGSTGSFRPLPEIPTVKGTRRLAREKALQLYSAQEVSGVPWRENFALVFPFEYRIDEPEYPNRLMSPEEIERLEADYIIEWEDDERAFAMELLDRAANNAEFTLEFIDKYSRNWETERIAHLDRVLLQLAITEFLDFPEIPPKVTINEAIEIAKKYSTERSSTFINGILDAVLNELRTTNRLHKTGRGLLDTPVKK